MIDENQSKSPMSMILYHPQYFSKLIPVLVVNLNFNLFSYIILVQRCYVICEYAGFWSICFTLCIVYQEWWTLSRLLVHNIFSSFLLESTYTLKTSVDKRIRLICWMKIVYHWEVNGQSVLVLCTFVWIILWNKCLCVLAVLATEVGQFSTYFNI